MKLKATCDLSQGHAALDDFARGIHERAIPRTLATLADQAETAGFRKVNELYQVPARTMGQYATIKTEDTQASITVKGKPFPLSVFKPIQTKTGVSVIIKGRRIVVPHSFMIARFGQHVFARGAYGGKGKTIPTGETSGRFVYGRGRLPIAELGTFGPADAFGNAQVTETMDERVSEQGGKVLAREIAAVRRGF